MARESVLSMTDKEAIKIEKFIFHIILKDDVQPHFLDELEITEEQTRFFKERLADAAQGRQYKFTDNAEVKELTRDIINNPETNFIQLSKKLTAGFKSTHTKNTNNGVFVISLASIGKRKLLFLVKLDHLKVIQYLLKEKKALLKEVQNTFVEDKNAVQKVALIDISDNVVWDVLVHERSSPYSITDYFKNFLSVYPRETEMILTGKTISLVVKWAGENRASLDPEQEPSQYKLRAIQHLWNTNTFETDTFVKAVIVDDDSDRRTNLETSLNNFLVEKGIAGQSFTINRNALTKKMEKNIRQTAEGVKIEWIGEAKDHGITIPNEPDHNRDYLITIKTTNIEELQ